MKNELATERLILFLGFDGMLHPEGVGAELEFVYLDNFERVMREYPQVRIVVSSSRRFSESVEELRMHFSTDIRKRIVGVTPRLAESESVRGQRQRECEAWIREEYFDEGCQSLLLIPNVHDGGAGLEGIYVETLRIRIGEVPGQEAIDHPSMVLAKAVIRCSQILGMDESALADALGVFPTFIEKLKRGEIGLDPGSQAGEVAAVLLRLHMALHTLAGGDPEKMTPWVKSFNTGLDGIPVDLLGEEHGLGRVTAYVENMLHHCQAIR